MILLNIVKALKLLIYVNQGLKIKTFKDVAQILQKFTSTENPVIFKST